MPVPSNSLTPVWRDKHADKFFNKQSKIKKTNLSTDINNALELSYAQCASPLRSWKTLLLQLWRVSWCCSFEKGRSAVAYVNIKEQELNGYQALYTKMAINLEYWVASQQRPCETAWTRRWRLGEAQAASLIHPMFLAKWPNYQAHLLSSPTLVGELDFVSDHAIIDFKNFLNNVDYAPVNHVLQMLVYVLLLKRGFNEFSGDVVGRLDLKHVSIYNILADRWYYIPIGSWTDEKVEALVGFILQQHYQMWLTHRG